MPYLRCFKKSIKFREGGEKYCWLSEIGKTGCYIHHIVLGRSFSDAGNKYNAMGYEIIHDILAYSGSLGRHQHTMQLEVAAAINKYKDIIKIAEPMTLEERNADEN